MTVRSEEELRAGRDRKKTLRVRTVSGFVFMALMIACSMFKAAFPAVMAIAAVIMMNEYLSITIGRGQTLQKVLAMITVASLILLVFFYLGSGLPGRYILLSAIPLTAEYIVLLYLNDSTDLYTKGITIFAAILYIGLPLTLTNLLVFDARGAFDGRMFLATMILVWANDSGAYIFGMLFGQNPGHKLCPRISPKKSWEGVWGGLAFTAIAAFLLKVIGLLPPAWWHCVALTFIAAVFADFGDLVESQLKRHYGVKDAGRIMPGHGGLLDRFDSLLFVLPAVVIYLKMFGII